MALCQVPAEVADWHRRVSVQEFDDSGMIWGIGSFNRSGPSPPLAGTKTEIEQEATE